MDGGSKLWFRLSRYPLPVKRWCYLGCLLSSLSLLLSCQCGTEQMLWNSREHFHSMISFFPKALQSSYSFYWTAWSPVYSASISIFFLSLNQWSPVFQRRPTAVMKLKVIEESCLKGLFIVFSASLRHFILAMNIGYTSCLIYVKVTLWT